MLRTRKGSKKRNSIESSYFNKPLSILLSQMLAYTVSRYEKNDLHFNVHIGFAGKKNPKHMRKSCNSIAQLKCTSWGDGHICTIQCSGYSHPWLSAFEIWPSRMRKSIFILSHCIWLHLYLNHHIQLAHTVCCPSCRQKPASNTLVWNLVENDSYSETWQDLCCLIFI